MKRTLVIGFLGLGAAALLGCPVFSGGGGPTPGCASDDPYCNQGCPPGSIWEPNIGECVFFDASATDSGFPDAPDCLQTGCPRGSVCAVVDAALVCIPNPDGPTSGGPDATDGPSFAVATDTLPPFPGCTSNAECATDGGTSSLCLDGTCVSPADQCTDGTQCHDSEQCVQGACVPSCAGGALCPTGYACTFPGDSGANGVCTGNPHPCGASDGGAVCGFGTTCVDEHCVPRCSAGDASCAAGLVCVDNGCIPDQKPVFTCNKDGVVGDGAKGNCDKGSICLHHSCYFTCASADASAPDASNSCSKETGGMFDVCKSVTTSSGTYSVCGSSSNLGSQCDPTLNPPVNCPSAGICIDGYCR
jgi:hypothetical protein